MQRLPVLVLFVAIFVAILVIPGIPGLQKYTEDDTDLLMFMLKQNVLPERYRTPEYFRKIGKTQFVKAFSYRNCGGNLPAAISKLTVTPDPLKLPGSFNVTAAGYINIDKLDAPLKTSLTIHKKAAGIWVKIPCLGDFGSCDYDDLCEILQMASECPDPIVKSGLGCQCPFKKGNYSAPDIQMDGSYGFPSGDYNLTGTIHYQGKYVACLEVLLSVASSDS